MHRSAPGSLGDEFNRTYLPKARSARAAADAERVVYDDAVDSGAIRRREIVAVVPQALGRDLGTIRVVRRD